MQNRLKEVKNGSTVIESYLYNPDGQRVKRTAGSTNTYYISPLYEISGSTVIKYYFFGGQRIAMKRGTTLTYLHADHLGSTVLETNSAGSTTANQTYCAYGRKRTISGGITTCGTGNSLVTDQTFTGQKLDGTGLQYYNSRYYDPAVGVFVSPDTIVPDATSVFDYNRFMYVVGNPLRYSDPTGHDFWDVIDTAVDFAQGVGAQVGYNNTVIAVPSAINSYTPQAEESTAMQVGRFVGNVATAVQGGAEMIGGFTAGTGGVAACGTGIGCLAGAPTVAGSAVVVAHGGTVATIGAVNAGAQLGNLYNAILGDGKSKSEHAQQRASEGRNTNRAFNDVQRARQSDMFVQQDGRYVIRGTNGREHIFDSSGKLITTINDRSNRAHLNLVKGGKRMPVTEEQFVQFKEIFK